MGIVVQERFVQIVVLCSTSTNSYQVGSRFFLSNGENRQGALSYRFFAVRFPDGFGRTRVFAVSGSSGFFHKSRRRRLGLTFLDGLVLRPLG